MQVWLRLLIVWFTVLALPVQGVAGAVMAHCVQSHERMGVMLASHDHHPAREAAVAHHHGEALVGAADQADDVTTQSSAQPDKITDLAKYKCSSCASCCAGSALPSALPRIPEPAFAPTVFAEDRVTIDAFASDGPDRPPRT